MGKSDEYVMHSSRSMAVLSLVAARWRWMSIVCWVPRFPLLCWTSFFKTLNLKQILWRGPVQLESKLYVCVAGGGAFMSTYSACAERMQKTSFWGADWNVSQFAPLYTDRDVYTKQVILLGWVFEEIIIRVFGTMQTNLFILT